MMDTHRWLRTAVWIVEAVPFVLISLLFRLLPVGVAARTGAACMAFIGPYIGSKHRHIRNNLSVVLRRSGGNASEADIEVAARDVWRNLGAVIAEYPHLARIARDRTTVLIPDSVTALIRSNTPIMFLSGHLANWEVIPLVLADRGVSMTVVYSPQANPLIERVIGFMRPRDRCEFVPKLDAARELLRAATRGRSLGVLADLRVDNGPELPFFGVAAPTTTVPARIAQRHRYAVVPLHVEREPGSRFRLVAEEPIAFDATDEHAVADTTLEFLRLLESWIVRHPGQWLCTKRRWPRRQTRPSPAVAQ